jgi:hypothetical protein
MFKHKKNKTPNTSCGQSCAHYRVVEEPHPDAVPLFHGLLFVLDHPLEPADGGLSVKQPSELGVGLCGWLVGCLFVCLFAEINEKNINSECTQRKGRKPTQKNLIYTLTMNQRSLSNPPPFLCHLDSELTPAPSYLDMTLNKDLAFRWIDARRQVHRSC